MKRTIDRSPSLRHRANRSSRRGAPRRFARLERLESRQFLDGNGDDLSPLTDEFDDPSTLAEWSEVNAVEGWGPAGAQLETWTVDAGGSGEMVLQPHTVVWYEDWRGPLVFKEVTGDFIITTRLRITDRDDIGGSDADDVPGDAMFSLGGLMMRTPRPITNGAADWQPGSHSESGQVGENYVFLSMGYTTGENRFSFEVKTTRNSTSQLELTPLGLSPNEVELRIARVGDAVIALHRLEGQTDWTVHRRYARTDFPETLQVGMVAYTDWEKANDLPPIVHNGSVMAPGQIVDPSPGQPFSPDVTASFDYARFARPQVPAELAGVDLVTGATDAQLLTFLGDSVGAVDADDPLVEVRLSAVDASDQPLEVVEVGQPFFLLATVDDLRADGQGVFSAYVDVAYPDELVGLDGDVQFGDSYPNQRHGDDATPGLLDETGGVGDVAPLGGAARTLFRVPLIATATGSIDWLASAGDVLPAHEFTLYDADAPVDPARIRFVTEPLVAVASATAAADQFVTHQGDGPAPFDVLANDSAAAGAEAPWIESVSTGSQGGSVSIAADGSHVIYVPAAGFYGEETFSYVLRNAYGQSAEAQVTVGVHKHWHNAAHATDVTGDGHTSPIDALRIINLLNRDGSMALPDVPAAGQADWPRVDVNDDAFLSPIDALLVINALNEGTGEGEGEGADGLALSAFASDVAADEPLVILLAPDAPPSLAVTSWYYDGSLQDLATDDENAMRASGVTSHLAPVASFGSQASSPEESPVSLDDASADSLDGSFDPWADSLEPLLEVLAQAR